MNGGDGWNGYGYDVRTEYIKSGRLNIEESIRQQNDADSDTDNKAYTNLQEITFGLDPGWVEGDNNLIFFKDGALIRVASPFNDTDTRGAIVSPPAPAPAPAPDDAQLCLPLPTKQGRISFICL